MDPNAALTELREKIAAFEEESRFGGISSGEEIVDQFKALDEWLTKGGFLPEAWQPKPETHPCPRCGKDTVWDTEHLPTAWRHVDHDSRWCEMADGETSPQMPPGTGNPDRYRTEDPEEI